MKALLFVLAMLAITSCATQMSIDSRTSEVSRLPIDQPLKASIEDYILALPPYLFHEGSIESFGAAVRSALTLSQNKGQSRDYLYVPGDGTWPAKEFYLDRRSQLIRVSVHSGPEPESKGYTITMRRVNGSWIRRN